MSKKEKIEVETSKEKNKKRNILIIVGVILLIIILFLLWFFNRKFDVTFDLNNGTKDIVVKVKYNKVIDKKDIKTKSELGDSFINWYEVVGTKDNEDILAKEAYDFKTKIKKNTKIKAVYEGVPETITITFDTRGGSSIDSVVINKGAELNLPNNPTYNGYNFVNWEDASGAEIKNNTKFVESTTIYAKWEKVDESKKEEPKKEEPKKETPKNEEPKKEEQISLALSKTLLHRNGVNASKATASTENVSGNVVYSVSNNCVSINSSTGDITANNGSEYCKNGCTVTVTATTPGGKTASANLTLEKDLNLTITAGSESKTIYSNGEFATPEASFEIIPNIDVVRWYGKCFYYSNCRYTGSRATLKRAFRGNFEQEIKDTGETKKDAVIITATTDAGQHLDFKVVKLAN